MGRQESWGAVGAFLMVFGALAFPFLWQPFEIACERGGDCVVRQVGLLARFERRFSAAGLQGARLEQTGREESQRSRKRGPEYRVVLRTSEGEIVVPKPFGYGYDEQYALATIIDRRGREGALTFRIEEPDHQTAIGCALMVVVGAIMAALAAVRRRKAA